jgi:imidazole glycerol-phosphate synthase subunit HisF
MKKKMFLGASGDLFIKAKSMRFTPTHSEMQLREYLRQKPPGFKFRRQHPVGIYIADFYCHALNLIIEVDGSIHQRPEIIAHDIERQKILESHGMKFLRFTDKEVENNLEMVISTLERYLSAAKV